MVAYTATATSSADRHLCDGGVAWPLCVLFVLVFIVLLSFPKLVLVSFLSPYDVMCFFPLVRVSLCVSLVLVVLCLFPCLLCDLLPCLC